MTTPIAGLGFEEIMKRGGVPARTASGKRKTDKHTLEALKAKTPEQRAFRSLRGKLGKVNAALSKSLEFFLGVCAEYGGTFHAVFNQTTTATHRLSSSGHRTWIELFEAFKQVQFQNMARIFKPLFRAKRKGWLMMEVDGSQLEFRVAAELGGPDPQALADILDPDFDAHLTSAAAMADIPYDELLKRYRDGDKQAKTLRTEAKSETFKPLYGGEFGTKKQMRWYKAFVERYKGISRHQKAWVQEVLRTHKLITPWGMRYYWPRASVSRSGYVNVKSSVYNYPVQALATAEIIPMAVVYLWHRLKDCDQVEMVNTVHDSVILEVHPDAIEFVRDEAIKAFGTDVYSYLAEVYGVEFQVPLGCGITIGEHWSEGDEENYNIWPDGRVEKTP
jgi:DNA polymerase I-like protein with 3'-5' exonuclease and polymerase domains